MSYQSVLGLLLSIACSSALADVDEIDYFSLSPEELGNIPISIATGSENNMKHSAAVTSLITAQQIEAMGAVNLQEVLETVPGLHVTLQAVTYDPIYSMRGMRNDVGGKVLMMMNGARFNLPYKGDPMTSMVLPVEAIQKIEIIRGPGSALYGADAFAGVINIITKKSADIKETELGVRGGQWDDFSGWAMHSDKLLGWDVSAILQYTTRGNDEDRLINNDLQSQFDRLTGTDVSNAPGAMQDNNEQLNTHVNLQRQYWEIDFWAYNALEYGMLAGANGALDNDGYGDGENYLVGVQYSTEDLLDDWELKLDSHYLYSDLAGKIKSFPDGAVLPIDSQGFVNVPSEDFRLFEDGLLHQVGIKNHVVSTDFSAIYSGFENHLLSMKAGYRYELLNMIELRNFGPGAITDKPVIRLEDRVNVSKIGKGTIPNIHRSIWSVVLQDEWEISEQWRLITGVRYDEYSDFGGTINPRAALIWDINDQITTKLLYGRAFKAPTFLEQEQKNNQFFTGNPNLKPETINTIELAVDYRPYEKLRIVANSFYYEIENAITFSMIDNILTTVNQQGQEGYGFELEWNWQFHDDWNFHGNYAWQYSIDKQLNQKVEGVPEQELYLAGRWRFYRDFFMQAQMNWIGRRVGNQLFQPTIDDYKTIDITLNTKKLFDHIDVSASVRNVFDENGREPALAAFPNDLPIASRNFYLEAVLRF